VTKASMLPALRNLSARLGRDITRTQGAGGNTSVKSGGIMWVKASGTWLAEAEDREIFVPVAVEPLVAALQADDGRVETSITDFVVESLNETRLRPSIETSVHAVLPQAVVVHFHCVNTIAHAVRSDAEALVGARMQSVPHLRLAMIPYRRPGVPLAHAIAQVASERPDVLVLRNHGIIIAGESVDEVDEKIEAVTSALRIEPRRTPRPDLDYLSSIVLPGYCLPEDEAIHAVALDSAAFRIARAGSLYPDHVIFLGTALGVMNSGSDVAATKSGGGNGAPKLILVPGRGVLVSETLSSGGLVMARCLTEVALRIDPRAPIEYLGRSEERELLHWEAEQYRQKLDRPER
jgi:rhamnose utilization protein RhaD (predicted bifunctional aldolase and dehydrogenase)